MLGWKKTIQVKEIEGYHNVAVNTPMTWPTNTWKNILQTAQQSSRMAMGPCAASSGREIQYNPRALLLSADPLHCLPPRPQDSNNSDSEGGKIPWRFPTSLCHDRENRLIFANLTNMAVEALEKDN
ncbi:hypothetical protein WISP_27160 [Willisornis vidua]|uniref:Uncharacterized protein n=1 Tax=Willisornis vidua TaxID=1566151 RepID=A0ABQ9DLJ4_9PASS|nr:hypothetical protein WISP_27160 [Willisornis vidua]